MAGNLEPTDGRMNAMAGRLRQDDTFVEFICDQLAALAAVTHKTMFGGYGLYCGGVFFGIVYRDRVYFKTNEESCKKYQGWGMDPFQPSAKQTLKSYYEVPPNFIDDPEELTQLAEEALDTAAGR